MAFDFGKFGGMTGQQKNTGGFDFGKSNFNFGNFAKVAENRIFQRQLEEEERQRLLLEKQQKAVEDFQRRQEEIQKQSSEGNIFQKTKAWLGIGKEMTGRGEVLPEIEGASPMYKAQREAQLAKQDYDKRIFGRLAIGAERLAGGVKDYFTKKKEEFEKSKEERGIVGTQIEELKGGAKNLGELASGAAKLGLEFSPLTGMSGIRKVINFVGGKTVEEYLDRNTPEYQKRVDAFLDDSGILNYKAEYANEIQKTGGDIAEIGSWFIPITRAGKAEKIEKAIAEIPRVAKVLGATPKVVKVGGKLMYEVSKDMVDVAVLDQLRGKTWEETKQDLGAVAVGGATLRTLGGVAGLLFKGRQNRIVKSVEQAIPDMDDAERKIAMDAVAEGKPIDDIATDIFAKREQAGKDIYKTPEVKTEAPKVETPEVEAPKVEIPKVETVPESPLIQEARKYKSAEEFVKAKVDEVHKLTSRIERARNAEMSIKSAQEYLDWKNAHPGELYGPRDKRILADGKTGMQWYKDYLNKSKEELKSLTNGGTIADLENRKSLLLKNPSEINVEGFTDIWNKANKTDDLLSEARKYKTAEEFVKAQGEPVYHGTSVDFKSNDFRGGYVTTDKKYADVYQKPQASSLVVNSEMAKLKRSGKPRTLEFVLPKNARVFDYTNPQHKKLLDDYWKTSSVSGEYVPTKSGQLDWTEIENASEYLESRGLKFDGIKVDEAGGIDPISGLELKRSPSIRILNPDILKTKSQLTSIWNKANKVVPSKKVEVPSSQLPVGRGKSVSPIIKRINQNLDEASKLDEKLDTTTHKEQLFKVEQELSENPKKVYSDAVFGGKNISDSLRTTKLVALLENAKVKGDQRAIAEIGQALAEHGRRSGQEVDIIKAMIGDNPTNKALIDLAKTKLQSVASRFKKLRSVAREGEDSVQVANRIVKKKSRQILMKERVAKVEAARNLIRSLTC